jgi:glycosyltransferase involved in cell wall biosynthesis
MAPTNVLVITNLYPYPWEPNRAAFNRQQFEKLAEISNVKIIVLVPWTSAAKNIGKLEKHKKNNVEIDYCAYLYPPKIGRSLYPLFIFLSLLAHYREIKKFVPDCMLLSWAFPDAVAGTLLAKFLKIPTVIKVHGSDINVHAEVKGRRWQIKWAMKQAKAIIAVSQALKTKVIEIGEPADKVHVLYNGIDKSLFYPIEQKVARASCNIAIDRKVILFIGNLKASKGCNLLLEAYALLAKQDSRVDLFFIGAGDQLNVLKGIVLENALEKTVHFLGPVNHSLLANWINSSDILALPSMNEGVPNVVLEAQSCGTPVVATNVGGIPEIVTAATGMLLEYGNKEILCETLKSALGRNWDRDKILNNNNILSWQDNSSKLLDMIKTAISES